MREFHDRRLLRKALFSSVSVIILALLLFFSIRGLLPIYERYSQARSLRQAAEGRLKGLEERKSELADALVRMTSERGFEEEVRKRFGVVRPGEGVVEIVDTPVSPDGMLEKRNFLERLLDLF